MLINYVLNAAEAVSGILITMCHVPEKHARIALNVIVVTVPARFQMERSDVAIAKSWGRFIRLKKYAQEQDAKNANFVTPVKQKVG